MEGIVVGRLVVGCLVGVVLGKLVIGVLLGKCVGFVVDGVLLGLWLGQHVGREIVGAQEISIPRGGVGLIVGSKLWVGIAVVGGRLDGSDKRKKNYQKRINLCIF